MSRKRERERERENKIGCSVLDLLWVVWNLILEEKRREGKA